mmetsp:Transcript_16287/g.47777  ORF Transcript_16287/g.47777 Transcript_16287/m.47777 type:complete len:258 (-) Transcript_16287:209-982(-)
MLGQVGLAKFQGRLAGCERHGATQKGREVCFREGGVKLGGGNITLESYEVTSRAGPIPPKVEQVFAAFRLRNVLRIFSFLQHRVHSSESLQELGSCLWSDARHSRDAIRGVPHEGLEINHLVRADAEPGLHVYSRDHGFFVRVIDEDLIRHELQEVLVSANNDNWSVGLGAPSTSGDDVVGLEARGAQDRPGEGAAGLLGEVKLGNKVIRRCRALRLVAAVNILPERWCARVESHHHLWWTCSERRVGRQGDEEPEQ